MATEPQRREPGPLGDPKARIEFLLRANEILRASLDLDRTLGAFTEFVLPALGDWLVLDVLDEAGMVERVLVGHADPAKRERTAKLRGRYTRDARAPWGPLRVLRTGRMLFFSDMRDPRFLATTAEPDELALIEELGLRAVLCVPLFAGPTPLGALTCVRGPSAGTFRATEMTAARMLAQRVAEAVTLGRLYDRAQAASRAKDLFMAMLGHELRNPISAIASAVRVLEQMGRADDAAAARVCAIIARQTRHLARLVEDLLDVARLTSGKVVLRKAPVDLAQVVERCIATLRVTGKGAHHSIALDAAPTTVEGDAARLEQVLANLLDNALKYTPPGGLIEVTARPDGDTALLRVRDTGAGIPRDVLPHVFDLFAQAEQPLDREPGGLGIGLTLVRRLVELHGGTVAARSPGPGEGTTVEVRLPLAPAGVGTPRPPGAPETVAAPPRHVLIVEDHADAREALRAVLESDGHRVDAAADAREAIALARRAPPDVALVDIGLPGMNGYDLARELRETAGGGGILLIALTGYGQAEDRRKAREAGFDAHLVKPVEPAELNRILAGVAPAAGPRPGPAAPPPEPPRPGRRD